MRTIQNPASHGHQMSSSNVVPTTQATNPNDYGRTMIDQYGRSYVQTPHGRIY